MICLADEASVSLLSPDLLANQFFSCKNVGQFKLISPQNLFAAF